MANPKNHHNKKMTGDQSFDDRATHLQKNIYGSHKGRLRLLILQRDLQPLIEQSDRQLSILDAGCGAGLMSEWALDNEHLVTACDSSEVMIDEVSNRLKENPNFITIHSTIQDLPTIEKYDVIFCHAVLEWVDDKTIFFDKLSQLLKCNGSLSLMFYNSWAREMAQLVYGNFTYVDRDFKVHQRVKLSPHYPISPDVVEQSLSLCGLNIYSRSGIRIFYDIMRDREHYQKFSDDIIRHELRISQQHPYWQMGRYVHFLANNNAK